MQVLLQRSGTKKRGWRTTVSTKPTTGRDGTADPPTTGVPAQRLTTRKAVAVPNRRFRVVKCWSMALHLTDAGSPVRGALDVTFQDGSRASFPLKEPTPAAAVDQMLRLLDGHGLLTGGVAPGTE